MSSILVWGLVVVAVAQAALATRAYLVERREGLPRSSARFAGSAGIAVVVIGLALFNTMRSTAPAAPPAPETVTDPATLKTIAADKAKIKELTEQLDKVSAELAKLEPSSAPPPEPTTPSPWPVVIAALLVVAGFMVLALGDLSTLIPRRRKKVAEAAKSDDPEAAPGELSDVPTLAQHAHAGRWKAGLACANRINIEQLHKLEALDYLYLRAFCGVMTVAAPEGDPPADKKERLASATSDLARLLELAPNMAEARWLAGYVHATAAEWQPALDDLRAARGELEDIGFDHAESVCLLMLAEAKLGAADSEGATKLFDEVTKLGALAAQIPVALVTHRILMVREHIRGGRFVEAGEGIALIQKHTDLDEAGQRAIAIACAVYGVAVKYRSGELQPALDAARELLAQWSPAKLPDVDDQVADEFLLPALDVKSLPLPADLYRGVFFLEAVVQVELASRRGTLTDDQVNAIATSLLRALQFQPRHRESLAALAALYLSYRKERSEKAIAWLDAAITMGVRSAKARGLLAEVRRAELERKDLLAMFRSAAARFLSDPAVGQQVRRALIEELGRFDEFRPVVLDLQDSGALDSSAAGEITISALRERAEFVQGVAAEVVRRSDPAAAQKLSELHRELASLAANVDSSATRIATLERSVMEQLGRIVLR